MIIRNDYDITELDSDQKDKISARTVSCACAPLSSLVSSSVNQLCDGGATIGDSSVTVMG
jgi:hypothetical protein